MKALIVLVALLAVAAVVCAQQGLHDSDGTSAEDCEPAPQGHKFVALAAAPTTRPRTSARATTRKATTRKGTSRKTTRRARCKVSFRPAKKTCLIPFVSELSCPKEFLVDMSKVSGPTPPPSTKTQTFGKKSEIIAFSGNLDAFMRVVRSYPVAIVELGATWCKNCKTQHAITKSVVEKMSNVAVIEADFSDIDDPNGIAITQAAGYEDSRMPFFAIFVKGKLVRNVNRYGVQSASELEAFIKPYVGTAASPPSTALSTRKQS
jgi:hypothetical protein